MKVNYFLGFFIIGFLAAHYAEGSIITKLIEDAKDAVNLDAFKDFTNSMVVRAKEKARCEGCKAVAGSIHKLIDAGADDKTIANVLIKTCDGLNIQDKDYCTQIVNSNLDTLLYVMREKHLESEDVCGTIFESYKCEKYPIIEWSIPLDKYGKKPSNKLVPKSTKKPVKIIHITDVHYDPLYKVGEITNCGQPLCCRDGQGKGSPGHAAGLLGDYDNCDLPSSTLEYTLQQLATLTDVSLIYVTGDFIPHNVQNVTEKQVIEEITFITNLIEKYLGDKKIFYALGNHDMSPPNQFSPKYITDPKYSAQWLYNLAVKLWGRSLTADAKETFSKSGYYTVLLDNGLRVISLNSQFSYCLNWWLMYDPKDPHGQLQWLADTLYQAEMKNEPCHILSHIPVGSIDALFVYSRELWKILSRFSNTVAGYYFGHTHYEQFNILYDYDNVQTPLLPMMNAGSLTHFAFVNTNYNLYEVDPETYTLLDQHCWIFNLTENKVPPRWFELYSFKTAYEIPSMDALDVNKVIEKMTQNKTWMEKYDFYYAKGAYTNVVTKCDDDCKKDRLREIVTNNYLDERKWNEIKTKIKW